MGKKEHLEGVVREKEKHRQKRKQREWKTVERGKRREERRVGENRGRWVLAALWRAPGVAPRRFGASNAETLRWCWLHIPTQSPKRRSLSRYSRTRNYAVAMTVRDSISRMYIHVHFSTFSLGPYPSPSRLFSLSLSLLLSFCTFANDESLAVRFEENTGDGSRINSPIFYQGRPAPASRSSMDRGVWQQCFCIINSRISCIVFALEWRATHVENYSPQNCNIFLSFKFIIRWKKICWIPCNGVSTLTISKSLFLVTIVVVYEIEWYRMI